MSQKTWGVEGCVWFLYPPLNMLEVKMEPITGLHLLGEDFDQTIRHCLAAAYNA